MTKPSDRVLRLMAWKADDPPSPELLDDLDLPGELLGAAGEGAYLQIIQATLDELTDLGLVEADSGGYRLTDAGQAALEQPPGDDGGPSGPVWTVTLYRPGRHLPWVIDEIAEVTETEQAEPAVLCPAGAGGGI